MPTVFLSSELNSIKSHFDNLIQKWSKEFVEIGQIDL